MLTNLQARGMELAKQQFDMAYIPYRQALKAFFASNPSIEALWDEAEKYLIEASRIDEPFQKMAAGAACDHLQKEAMRRERGY